MAKANGNEVIRVTRKEYKRDLNRHTRMATDFALAGIYTALRDSEGFGTKRIVRVHQAVEKLYEEIDEGRINLVDLYQMIQEECGIVFKRGGDPESYARGRKKYEKLEQGEESCVETKL